MGGGKASSNHRGELTQERDPFEKSVGYSHTWAPSKKQPRGQNFGHLGGGLEKLLQGGGGKTFLRIWEGCGRKKKILQIFSKNIEESKFSQFFSFFPQKSSKCLMFSLHQGGGSSGKLSFSTIGGVKNYLREGGLCFGGSAYGNPPLPPPLAHLWV